jgi:hypothetical protein
MMDNARRHGSRSSTRSVSRRGSKTCRTYPVRLAFGPSTQITTWQGYAINGYRFHTKEKDKKSVAQNSGVQYEGVDDSTRKTRTYFGQIEDIWELDYGGDLQLAVFRC